MSKAVRKLRTSGAIFATAKEPEGSCGWGLELMRQTGADGCRDIMNNFIPDRSKPLTQLDAIFISLPVALKDPLTSKNIPDTLRDNKIPKLHP